MHNEKMHSACTHHSAGWLAMGVVEVPLYREREIDSVCVCVCVCVCVNGGRSRDDHQSGEYVHSVECVRSGR